MTNAPGINGFPARPFGAVTITAACAPHRVEGALAFTLACGGTLTAGGSSPVAGEAVLIDSAGQTHGSVERFTLLPGQSFALATPPSGQQWLVADMSHAQAGAIATEVLVGVGAILGLAAYGAFEIGAHLVARHRRKKAIKRLGQWFWGH